MVIGLTLSVVVVWFGLLWIARRYRLKQLSDQTFLFDALWLSVSLWLTVYLMGADSQFRFPYLLGLLPFALYRVAVGYGLKRVAARAEIVAQHVAAITVAPMSTGNVLVLATLALRRRHPHQRNGRSPDRFEPDEFLIFLSSRLAGRHQRQAQISTVVFQSRFAARSGWALPYQ
jgi:hypothetical protein